MALKRAISRMIISHTHKFIFIKSIKTAGTSVEAALSNYCEGDDVVTPLNKFAFNRDDESGIAHRSMNAETLEWWDRESIGQHVDASTIKSKVSTEVWNGYFKFSITRNPWDRVVSLFTWRARRDAATNTRRSLLNSFRIPLVEMRQTRKRFSYFVRSGPETNDRFYLMANELCLDFVIRYEHLNDDLASVCREIGLAGDIPLPRLKAGIRPSQYHYSEYYDDQSKKLVGALHSNDLRLFGYEFGSA